jgi:hypothetical protein
MRVVSNHEANDVVILIVQRSAEVGCGLVWAGALASPFETQASPAPQDEASRRGEGAAPQGEG